MRRVWSNLIVVALPGGQHGARLPQRGEQRLVQAFVAQSADEAFGERVLLRLARGDVVPNNLSLLAPAQDRVAGQFGAVVADTKKRPRIPASGDRGQFPRHPSPPTTTCRQSAQDIRG